MINLLFMNDIPRNQPDPLDLQVVFLNVLSYNICSLWVCHRNDSFHKDSVKAIDQYFDTQLDQSINRTLGKKWLVEEGRVCNDAFGKETNELDECQYYEP